MARRKGEIALHRDVTTNEDWEDMLTKPGVTVVDVYQKWCGYCKAMTSNFRRLRNEIADDLLQFVAAQCDTIDALYRYRGRCEPCFLFYASGVLVEVIRGANPPVLQRAILNNLSYEHKVLDGEAERVEGGVMVGTLRGSNVPLFQKLLYELVATEKLIIEGKAERVEIKDPMFAHLDELEALERKKAEEEAKYLRGFVDFHGERIGLNVPTLETKPKDFTVLVVKPEAKEHIEDVKLILEEKGLEIHETCEKTLSEEEALDYLTDATIDEEWNKEELLQSFTNDPVTALLLTRESGIILKMLRILGPMDATQAKECNPESLRGRFGEEHWRNGFHCSLNKEKAQKDLEFFFPEIQLPRIPLVAANEMEQTLALIRPTALSLYKEKIRERLLEAEFTILYETEMDFPEEMAKQFYGAHVDQPWFEDLIKEMTSGPLYAAVLAKEHAVDDWRELIGPKDVEAAKEKFPESLRAEFVLKEGSVINTVHGSDSVDEAKREIQFLFPVTQTVALIKPDAFESKDEIMELIKSHQFKIVLSQEITLSEEQINAIYPGKVNEDWFPKIIEHLMEGPSLLLVLSRPDAVEYFREVMGPTDPESAKQIASVTESIRAKFGTDLINNAIHGSSTSEIAMSSIHTFFGEDIQFDENGDPSGASVLTYKDKGEIETENETEEKIVNTGEEEPDKNDNKEPDTETKIDDQPNDARAEDTPETSNEKDKKEIANPPSAEQNEKDQTVVITTNDEGQLDKVEVSDMKESEEKENNENKETDVHGVEKPSDDAKENKTEGESEKPETSGDGEEKGDKMKSPDDEYKTDDTKENGDQNDGDNNNDVNSENVENKSDDNKRQEGDLDKADVKPKEDNENTENRTAVD